MKDGILISADLLVRTAEKLLVEHGLLLENEVLGIIKAASNLIWDNADPEEDEKWVYWITSRQLYVEEYIVELHKAEIRKYFAE